MGQYNVTCNGSSGLSNLAGGVGELHVNANSLASAKLFFYAGNVPAGEVLDRASALAVYLNAPYPISLLLGNIAGPSWTGPEWKQTADGVVFTAGQLQCPVAVSAEGTGGTAQIWVNGSAYVPYATLQTHAGKITPTGLSPANTTIKKGFYQRFSWSVSAETPINGTLTVAYTNFKYRALGATTWTTVRVPGPDTYLNFDTGILPNTSNPGMEWYVEVVASSGAAASSGYTSVQFESTEVRLNELTPAANATTYKGFPVVCSWQLDYTQPADLTGSIKQVSARVRWRKTGETAVTEYAVNNATQTYTIAAGALPAGDVDWQVEVTDTSGGVTTSSWTKFNSKELEITINDLYPAATAHAVKSIVNRFGWTFTVDDSEAPIVGYAKQSGAVLYWRNAGETAYHEVSITGEAQYYDMPASTFTAAAIDWYVTVLANTGTQASSAVITVSTADTLSTPVCVAPSGVYVDDTDGCEFKWQHINETGTVQSAYELQTSIDAGASFTTLANGQGAANSFTSASKEFPLGSIYWRVRTKNADGVWGSYSPVAIFVVKRRPDAPRIIFSSDSLPLPVLRWQASDQTGFEIMMDGESLGVVNGPEKEWRGTDVLSDGPHTCSVRIFDKFEDTSSWTTITMQVANVPSGSIGISFRRQWAQIQLTPAVEGTFIAAYLLRDGKIIAKNTAATAEFIDRASVGVHAYRIRAFDAAGYYTDSPEIYADPRVPFGAIGLLGGTDWVLLKTTKDKNYISISRQLAAGAFMHYFGRERPVYDSGSDTGVEEVLTAEYLLEGIDVSALAALQGKTVVYKDLRGNLIVGTFTDLPQSQSARKTTVTIKITATEQEAMAYDPV